MPMPPKLPIKINGKNMTYLEALSLRVKKYIEAEGLTLNFDGYQETINRYERMNKSNINDVWEIGQELNAWSEYLSDLRAVVSHLLKDTETEKKSIIAMASINADTSKVANGNRLANRDTAVIEIRKKRNALEAILSLLDSKITFLDKAYYYCKGTCEWATKAPELFK